nr:reverse transcriptase domain-containing protein [Tanacetum cinerariifolium]
MVVRITKHGYYWPSMHQDAAKVIQDYEKCKEQSAIRKTTKSSAIIAGSVWLFSHWGVNILGPLRTAHVGFKFLAIAVEHFTKWVEAKPMTTISGRHAERFAIILISENNVAKDDRERIKEVDKRRESKEVASIKEAYYRNKLRRYQNERSSHSTYKIVDFILLS